MGPKYKEKEQKEVGSIYYPQFGVTSPTWAMLGRPDSDVTSINHLKPTKTKEPGPGQYTDKDR